MSVDLFLKHNRVHLPGAFSRDLAEEWVAETFRRLEIDEHDPETWPSKASFPTPPLEIPLPKLAPKAWQLICEILGGHDAVDPRSIGIVNKFSFNFKRGADERWRRPSRRRPGWHKDGWFFRHFIDSPEQALLVLLVWRDILPRSGGTFYSPDSVRHIARALRRHPEGLHHGHQWNKYIHRCWNFKEVTAKAGDILILHPFTLHTSSNNPSGRIRVMHNKCISLKQPMCFDRPDGRYSPLERSILKALRVERLDYRITRTRRRSSGGSPMPDVDGADDPYAWTADTNDLSAANTTAAAPSPG